MNDLDRTREALSFVPANDRDTWVRMGMAIKSEFGDAGFDLWKDWSRQDESFDERVAHDVWKSVHANGKVTLGTLFHEAKAHGWTDDGTYRKPTPEELAERQRIAAESALQEEAEIARERADTAAKATAVFKASVPAKADNPYLARKQVAPVPTLKEIDAGEVAAILGYTPKSGGEPLSGRLLVVPVKQGDRISTLELIDESGRKTALAGRGTKAGGYWASERLPEGDGTGLTLLVGEGVATVISAKEATSRPVVAALASSNLLAVAQAMRKRYPAATLVILADLVKSTGEPDHHAVEAARAVNGRVAIPLFEGSCDPNWSDFNDLRQARGLEAVACCIEAASEPEKEKTPPEGDSAAIAPESDDEAIIRLAKLPAPAYERVRAAEAKRLGMRASVLDKIVQREQRDSQATEGIGFDDVEPWPDSVAGDQLLSDVARTIARFIVCKPEVTQAAALWVAMTWFMDVVQVAPLAVITAPEKRCGKSQLLTLLGKLSHRPMVASNISAAALFRVIDAWQPSLMVDEADAFLRDNEELRGILNSGHTRDSAYVVRTVGEDFTPKQFSTWGAKAIAGIGHLADTLMDRAIILNLRRKMPYENVERLRYAEPELFSTLAAKLARWAGDHREAIRRARPDLPEQLNDRAQDNWEPLLAIADVAGGIWPEQARKAALVISAGSDESNLTLGAELLSDIKEIFETRRVERISTAELIEALCSDDERPWATYNRGKPISPRQVAKRLKGYGIASKTIRIGYGLSKGYEVSQFQDVFMRYLVPPVLSVTTLQPSNHAGYSVTDSQNAYVTDSFIRNSVTNSPPTTETRQFGNQNRGNVTDNDHVTVTQNASVTLKPSNGKDCYAVTDKKGGTEDNDVWGVTEI